MRFVMTLNAAFTAFLLLSSCAFGFGRARTPIPTPLRERCTNGLQGCICSDLRLKQGEYPPNTLPVAGTEFYIRDKDKKMQDGGCLDYEMTNPIDADHLDEFHSKECFGAPKPKKTD